MELRADVHIEAAKIEDQIRSFLGLKAGQLVFEYATLNGKIKLDLITINPRHNQSFLFRSEEGIDKIDAVNKLFDYVKRYKEEESSFTIQWSVKGGSELQTSYFWGKNIYDALDKLYYDRDMNTINVYSVVLNPIT